jgi:hypothetical protein
LNFSDVLELLLSTIGVSLHNGKKSLETCRWCLTNPKSCRIGQGSSEPAKNLHIRPANENQRPAELTNKKERFMTKYTQITYCS